MPVSGQILGIEGTAWNLSAALFENNAVTAFSSHAYRPPAGGIHPREASQHHAEKMREVISSVLSEPEKVAAVAFSQGPGLGPCLRTVATAARSIASALDVPLIGVNHCVAHIEIGRWATGCDDPIVLYASGANTQVLGFLNERYRIFGETLDIGLGNALDKFARKQGLPHPGGPLIEKYAKEGTPVCLPYTVKGMDLAFSGLMSAAADCKAPLEDVCAGFQETAFAMCVEVTERALAHAGKEEVLLVGGVGANKRLQAMLRTMCEERGATLFVPENRFIGDNGAMIALTGSIMFECGQILPIGSSQVLPGYRSDEVVVQWRDDTPTLSYNQAEIPKNGFVRGAEAVIERKGPIVEKRRLPKIYRTEVLDRKLMGERTRAEARLLSAARRHGVRTPIIHDLTHDTIIMEYLEGPPLKCALTPENVRGAGHTVGRLHTGAIIHGDLTTSNMVVVENGIALIDFGLAYISDETESRGVDVHVFFQTLESTSAEAEMLKEAFVIGYQSVFSGADEVFDRVEEIRLRGRYL